MTDLNKPVFLLTNWLYNFRNKVLDNFLYGFLENNIGLYKHYTRNWPVVEHPVIDTNNGFIVCYATSLYHVCSISIFLWGRIIWTNFTTALMTHANKLFNWVIEAQCYWLTEAKIIVTNNFLATSGLTFIVSYITNFYTTVLNFNVLFSNFTLSVNLLNNSLVQYLNFFSLKSFFVTKF
jgi:hypothetical protein